MDEKALDEKTLDENWAHDLSQMVREWIMNNLIANYEGCLSISSLIMRDARENGIYALEILREHYVGSSETRMISLYTEHCSLKMGSDASVTDCVIRAANAATLLRNLKEMVSDSLLIAMLL